MAIKFSGKAKLIVGGQITEVGHVEIKGDNGTEYTVPLFQDVKGDFIVELPFKYVGPPTETFIGLCADSLPPEERLQFLADALGDACCRELEKIKCRWES